MIIDDNIYLHEENMDLSHQEANETETKRSVQTRLKY